MKLGILVPHYGSSDKSRWLLYNLFDSIERYEPGLMKSIVVCDDASPVTDKELHYLLSPYGVTLLRRKENAGYSRNVNMGLDFLRKNNCKYALILNNDITLVQPVLPLMEYFKVIKSLAVVGVRLWFPNGRLQHGGLEVLPSQDVSHEGYGAFSDGRETRFCHAVTGAFQLIDLGLVERYPEEYPLGYEDVAFCLRTWMKGGLVLYTNAVSAIHAESATRGYVCGPKEYASLNEFHRAEFQLPEVDDRVRQAQADFPHERLNTLLCHQPIPPYVRDFRKLDALVRKSDPTRKAEWAQVRKHRKLGHVGPAAKH